MTREERDRINRIVEALLCIAPDRRAIAIDALCPAAENGAVRAEVERLIEDDDQLTQRLAGLNKSTIQVTATVTTGEPASKSSVLAEHLPAVIDRYHIRSRLGSGGMGEVYLAEQLAPIRQTVALKLIKSGFDTFDVIARFDAERQVLARMDHPNIARMLDAGATDAGRPFFVMEFAPGKPVTHFADENCLSIRQRLQLFAEVCEAVAHAHTKGIIHRDLKPSNVLAWMHEGEPRVKVIDFGIAKALTDNGMASVTRYATQAGTVLGTYEYMSPEQAAGSVDLDTRTDIYSLGVLLYELLTGLRPFDKGEIAGRTDEELRRLIREVDPPGPSERVRALPDDSAREQVAANRRTDPATLIRTLQRELEWIPLKAMRKERDRRYSSTADLAADVEKYLHGRALLAAPESRFYLVRKTVARYRAPIAVALALLFLMILAVVGTSFGLVREASARRRADWAAYRAAVAAADVALQNGDAVRLRWALQAAPPSLRGWEWQAFAWAARPISVSLRADIAERFVESAATPDALHAWSTTGPDGISVLWDLRTGLISRRENGFVATDPTSTRFAIARPDGSIELADTNDAAIAWRAEPIGGRAWRLCANSFSLDGRLIVAWDGSVDVLTLFDRATGKSRQLHTGVRPTGLTGFLDLGDGVPSGQVVFTSNSASGTFVIDVASDTSTRTMHIATSVGRTALTDATQLNATGPGQKALLPRSGRIASGNIGGSVALFDTTRAGAAAGSNPVERFVVGDAPVKSIVATPDEQRLVVTLQDGTVHAIAIDVARPLAIPMRGSSNIELSPDGSRLLLFGWGDVQCVDPLTGSPLWGRNLGPYQNQFAAWSPDGGTVVVATRAESASARGSPISEVFVLDGHSGEQRAAWSSSAVTPDPTRSAAAPTWAGAISGLEFSADGKLLFVSRDDGTLARIDVSRWESIGEYSPPSAPLALATIEAAKYCGSLRRSPDAGRLAQLVVGAARDDKQLRSALIVRDIAAGSILFSVTMEDHAPTAVAWSPDGRTLAAGFTRAGSRAVIGIIDAATGKPRSSINSPDGSPILSICYSPAGDRIIATSRSQRVILDPTNGQEILSSARLDLAALTCFIPDGAFLDADGRGNLTRTNVNDPELRLPAVLSSWPSNVTQPRSVAEAQRLINSAVLALIESRDQGKSEHEALTRHPEFSPQLRDLTLALAPRRSVNINSLNSAGLAILWGNDAKLDDLERAAVLFRAAIAIKPHSYSLQANLGQTLFRAERYAECRAPLALAQKLRASKGIAISVADSLQLAIAAQRVGDPEAERLYREALMEMDHQAQSGDVEVRPLLAAAKRVFQH